MALPITKIRLPEKVSAKEVGLLTFHFREAWTVEELVEYLSKLSYAYTGLNEFLYTAMHFDLDSDSDTSVLLDLFSIRSSNYRLVLNEFHFDSYFIPLTVNQIHLSSPGIAEVIGNLNPLKTIADFITAWRQETTRRRELRSRGEFDRFVVETEALKFLVEHIDKFRRKDRDYILERFLSHTLNNPQFDIADMADSRKFEALEIRALELDA